MKSSLLFCLFVTISGSACAGDIGLGTIEGIKVYDYGTLHFTKIFLSDTATNKDIVACDGVGQITHSLRDSDVRKEMMSIALSAYVAGKKVRLLSSVDTCETDFIAIQETYF